MKRRILVTRPASQAGELVRLLEERGIDPESLDRVVKDRAEGKRS